MADTGGADGADTGVSTATGSGGGGVPRRGRHRRPGRADPSATGTSATGTSATGPSATGTSAAAPTATSGRRRVARGAVTAGAGVVTVLVVLLSVGHLTTPVGAADNGDGGRLYCGAGLVPRTADGLANWKGGVVVEFATGGPVCPDPVVSSALPLLRLATVGAGPTFSLTRLGVLYAVLLGLAAAAAAWSAAGERRSHVLVLLPALVPLVGPTFSRFFVSTYSEPAGLLGASVLLLGVGVLAVTRRASRAERVVGLVLTAGGGVLAATAKASYAPLLLLAVVVCALSALQLGRGPRARDHLVGTVVAVVAVLAAVAPVLSAVAWQQRTYGVVNTHNLVFTAVLPGVGDAALEPLGLPTAAAEFAGRAFYPESANGYPGSEVVAAAPQELRSTSYRLLATHPVAALRTVRTGLAATLGADVGYLPSAPVTSTTVAPVLGTTVGEQGADRAQLTSWLQGLPAPWLPGVVALLGLGVGALRRGPRVAVASARVAAVASLSAGGLVVAAVLGDGFFEVAKHVWLAAYLLCVAGTAVVLTAVTTAASLVVRRRRAGPTLVP